MLLEWLPGWNWWLQGDSALFYQGPWVCTDSLKSKSPGAGSQVTLICLSWAFDMCMWPKSELYCCGIQGFLSQVANIPRGRSVIFESLSIEWELGSVCRLVQSLSMCLGCGLSFGRKDVFFLEWEWGKWWGENNRRVHDKVMRKNTFQIWPVWAPIFFLSHVYIRRYKVMQRWHMKMSGQKSWWRTRVTSCTCLTPCMKI